jgi:segregation and condensation protein B
VSGASLDLVTDSPSLRQALEAILFVVDEPVDVPTLAEVLETTDSDVRAALEALRSDLGSGRGFVLREVAGGWRLYTAPEAAPYVERFVLNGRSGRLSQAALETLAVIAYKQPISRHAVGEIRGVNADGAIRTLIGRGLVEEVGRDDTPGQPILYGTTTALLEKLGLADLGELPELTDFLAEGSAPEEPAPDHLRLARERLRDGGKLPSTGRSRWDPDAQPDPLGEDVDPGSPDDEPHAQVRVRAEEEMDELTDELERVAREAMVALEDALGAVDGGEPQGEGGGS